MMICLVGNGGFSLLASIAKDAATLTRQLSLGDNKFPFISLIPCFPFYAPRNFGRRDSSLEYRVERGHYV